MMITIALNARHVVEIEVAAEDVVVDGDVMSKKKISQLPRATVFSIL